MGGCVSTKAPANLEGPPQRAVPTETKDVRTTRRGPGGSVETPTTPQCRTDASSMPSPAIATTPPWGFTSDGEPNGRIRTVQPRRRRQPPGAVPSSSVSPSALQTRTYSDSVKRVAVKPSLSQVTKTLAWKVAASTSGMWAARVEVVGRSEANIRLSLTEQVDRDKAVFSVHFPASFPEVPCVVSYKGPRFDSPLDVELALGFPHHPQLRPDTWTRYTDLADLILSSVIPTLDAYHPLPEPTADVLEWNNVETRLIGLVHPHMQQQQGREGGLGGKDRGLRGVFVGLRRLLDEMEADGGSMERLVHFNVLDWTDGLLGRVGDVFVPACDYDDARLTLNRLVKVLAMAHDECHDDDAHIEGLRTRVSDVTKRWAVRRRAMSKNKKGAAAGANAAAEDLWTFVLETAKLKYAKEMRVERSVTVDDGDDEAPSTTDALDTFIKGAREQHLLSGPYWSALALAYQLISNEQAAVASITIPSDRIHNVMRKGFEALYKKPTDNVLNEDDAENEEEDDGSAAAGGVDVRSALRDELKLVLEARKAGGNQPSNARKADSHKDGQRTIKSSFKFVSDTTMAFMDTRVATKGDIPSDATLVMALLLTPPAYRSSLEYDDEGTVPIWQVKRPSDKTVSYALPLGVVHTLSSSNKKEEKAGAEPAQ